MDAFSINANNGGLTSIGGSPFSAGSGASSIAATTTFVYVTLDAIPGTNPPNSRVAGFSINSSSGALVPLPGSPFPVGDLTALGSIVHPSGKFLYVGNFTLPNGTIYVFTIDSVSGALSPVVGSPFLIQGPLGGNPRGPVAFAIGGQGKFLYAGLGVDPFSNLVVGFSIDSGSGALTQFAGSPFTLQGEQFSGLTTDATGTFLFATTDCCPGPNSPPPAVSAFTIDLSSGNLIPTAFFSRPPGDNFSSGLVDPNGKFLYVGGSALWVFSTNPTTGVLSLIAGSPFFDRQNSFFVSAIVKRASSQ